jgi:signal transduction histidine kinase
MDGTTTESDSERLPMWKYIGALAPAVIFWLLLVGGLAYLLFDRGRVSIEADQANLREWLDETRVFRKTLPELVREYLNLLDLEPNADPSPYTLRKVREIQEQLRALADPIRIYQGQLPLFPEIYLLEVTFPNHFRNLDSLTWESPVPRPRQPEGSRVGQIEYPLIRDSSGVRAVIHCQFRLHAFNRVQRDEQERQTLLVAVIGVIFGGSLLAILQVWAFLRRERRRELNQMQAARQLEHTEKLMLTEQLRAEQAERLKEELDRRLLQQSLESAKAESRASEAEKSALQLKSQLYASIGIMAGSYAHNIKNLLVRPNDLIARCLEVDGLRPEQSHMLNEVRSTLGTVTDRLQQILRTVRRDPNQAEMTRIDLAHLVHDTERTWAEIGREKWKLTIAAHAPDQPVWIQGDLSHLQQAIENLVFNARDAIFEMRNHLREEARSVADAAKRRQAIIDAAAWKGRIDLALLINENAIVLEVTDEGIGMTEAVRENCVQTYFSTKRDNALYAGYNAGMGLGLSFVVMVLEHHDAKLQIDSHPLHGAKFRIEFPKEV